jgi:hypothetical protein
MTTTCRSALARAQLLKFPTRTAYDRAGRLRQPLGRKEAFEKWTREQEMLEEMQAEELDKIKNEVAEKRRLFRQNTQRGSYRRTSSQIRSTEWDA